MNKNTRKSLRNGKTKVKHAGPSVENSTESTEIVIEPRRSFWKSFSSIFKCSTKRRRRISDSDENEQRTILPVQNLPPIIEASDSLNDTASIREDIDDVKTILKKYSIIPNAISMVQRIDSQNVSKQSSLTGYVTDVSASSSDEEESARKKVLLKNKINEFKHEIIRAEETANVREDDKEKTTVKIHDNMATSSSILTVDKDTYSFDYSESSQQSMTADGNEEKLEKVMFDNNIKVKDENDIVTVDSINDASHQIRDITDDSYDEDLDESVNYDKLKHEEKVALVEEQYNIALSTVDKIEEQITAYSKHLEDVRTKGSIEDMTEQQLENRDTMQNAMKVFGTKIMDNQGSNLLRHLHDMRSEAIQSNALSLDESVAKPKAMNMQMDEYRRKFGYAFPHFPSTRFDDNHDDDEAIQDNCTSCSSESLNEVEVWSKDLNSILKYVDRRDLPIFSKFEKCPVNEDGYKVLRLNSLFVAIAHPVSLKYKVVYDPLVENNDDDEHDHTSNLVTHKHKYMSLVDRDAMYEEDSVETVDKATETYYTNEEKWESCTNETESVTEEHAPNVTDDEEDSDWKTVDLEEIDVTSLANTEDSHEEYVNQQNRYNLMSTLPRAGTKRANPPVEFKVTMRNQHKENLVREYLAYRNVKNLVDKSTSYSSLPAADTMEVLYKNQDAQSEESTSVTARVEDNEISMTFRNIDDDVQHMINDLLIDVSELKDGCMEITNGMCDERMVELKQTSNGVTSCIDTSSRISEALAQTIIHEILDDVFYFSEEHVDSEDGSAMLHHEPCDMDESNHHDECEDTLEGQYIYMRKDDRTKVFKNLDEVMQDLADDTLTDQGKMNAEMDEEEYSTCPVQMKQLYQQRVNDEKMRLLQVQSILQHMLQREANKHRNKDGLENSRRANDHACTRKSTGSPKYTTCDSVANERKKLLTDTSPHGCNYHRFFNNNFSIKSGFIGTPNSTTCNTCSNLVRNQCTAASGLEPADHFKASHNTGTDEELTRYAEKQQIAKLRNSVYRKSDNYQRIELPKYSQIWRRKNKLMVDKCTGNEQEITDADSTHSNKSAVAQNIEENLWSFEEAMRNLIRVNKKTAKLLKSSCVFSAKPNSAENKPCCSSKRTENLQSTTENTCSKKSISKNVTASDKSLTKTKKLTDRDQCLTARDQNLTERDQKLTATDQSLTTNTQNNLSANLEKILSNFSQQFSECQDKSNLK